MKKYFLYIGCIALLLILLAKRSPVFATSKSFVLDETNFANPERGFLHFNGEFGVANLTRYREVDGISLVMINYYLSSFYNKDIDANTIATLQSRFDALRSAGLKVVLRFSYTESRDGTEASLTQVLRHIDQLTPLIRANSDVIVLWQAGFIGSWGEWYYTGNSSNDFGDAGNISAPQWANRKQVLDKMLNALPNRMISVRTPLFKRTLYGTSLLTSATAYGSNAASRIGYYNDAFLASSDDYGTYENKSVEYPYMAAETNFVPMGGENDNQDSPRSDCSTALKEMKELHFTYLNIDYYKPTLDSWVTGGCMDTIKKSLGYRFALINANYPNSATAGSSYNLSFTIKNLGFASLFNPRPVYVVLFNDHNSYKFPINTDVRNWKPENNTVINQNIVIPSNITTGTYKLAIWLPDQEPALQSKPYFSIRFANIGVWDSVNGFNVIDDAIQVGGNGGVIYHPGDINHDGHVNIFDFNLLISQFGTKYTIFDFNNIIAGFGL